MKLQKLPIPALVLAKIVEKSTKCVGDLKSIFKGLAVGCCGTGKILDEAR
ncbi:MULTISPECIES: hypothetical protein [unclassified Rhizobium]|nr:MULTISPECIES: hypothetical protein [unclassified Rhizobium]MDM9648830.1 hypothetical protein [Rhizobium sp. S163]